MKLSKAQETDLYGAPVDKIVASVKACLQYQHHVDINTLLCSYLSDAQEMIERGDNERARQYINIVKMLIIVGVE